MSRFLPGTCSGTSEVLLATSETSEGSSVILIDLSTPSNLPPRFALVRWSAWCVDMMHHAVHKVVKRMGGQTSKARGACGVHGVRNFLFAKNAP